MSIGQKRLWNKPFAVDPIFQWREHESEAYWLAAAEWATRKLRLIVCLCLGCGAFSLYRIFFSPVAQGRNTFLVCGSIVSIVLWACLPVLYRWRARKARAAVSSAEPPSA